VKILLMVIFVLAYVLTAMRAMVNWTATGSAVLAAFVNVTSFAGMMLILFMG